ncbi:MAG: hypothetical protein K1X83_01845 [Oligoflexia bacterium]|nr:hypothetical protein [Oligoflexia bacterium]
MSKAPTIALISPDDAGSGVIMPLFSRHDYELRPVVNLAELLAWPVSEQAELDCVVVPLRLRDGSSGVGACLQLKSNSVLTNTPIIGLAQTTDKPILQSFFEMGADVVLLQPFDADLLYLHIGSMTRQRRAFAETIQSLSVKISSKGEALDILNLAPSPMIVFSERLDLEFINNAALTLLGLEQQNGSQDALWIKENFEELIVNHRPSRPTPKNALGVEPAKLPANLAVTRPDGLVCRFAPEIVELIDKHGRIKYIALILHETAQLSQLHHSLLLGQRTRSVGLMTTAACIRLIESAYLGSGSSVLNCSQEFLEGLPKKSRLNLCLTRLLEFVDLLLSSGISLRVDVEENLDLAVTSTDLIQLLGQMLLYASEFIGGHGEIRIKGKSDSPGNSAAIEISCISKRGLPFLPNPRLSRLLAGKFDEDPSEPSHSKLGFGLIAAQKIAQKYRSAIEFKSPSEQEFRVRVKLPAIKKEAEKEASPSSTT